MMGKMARALLSTLVFSLVTSGCSIYRSSVRKEFESNSLGRVAGVETLKSIEREKTASHEKETCRVLGPVQSWLESEFPGEEEELLHSDTDHESWLAHRADGTLRLKTFEPLDDRTLVCERVFASEREWLESEQRR